MWNRHRESVLHEIHEIGSGTKLYYLWVKGFRHEERERHNLSMLTAFTSSALNLTRGARSTQIRLASPSSECRISRSEAGTQLTAFSQISKSSAHASGAWRHSHPLVTISIWDFYFDIYEWHILTARAWTPALMLHLTKPCTKLKVLILTKPKGKTYKRKSFCHYITVDIP